MKLQLLDGDTSTNSAPSGAVAGKDCRDWRHTDRGVLVIHATAGSGTMTGTFKIWGYSEITSTWYPLGVDATAANKGLLNDGNAVGETGANAIAHAEPLENISAFDRLYLEITAIGGTATAFDAHVISRS